MRRRPTPGTVWRSRGEVGSSSSFRRNRVRALLRRGALVPAAATQKLTPREMDVLRLLAFGSLPTEIANRLGISPKTVSTHLERIYMKLGVQSRAQAVALAYREQLVDALAEPPTAPYAGQTTAVAEPTVSETRAPVTGKR